MKKEMPPAPKLEREVSRASHINNFGDKEVLFLCPPTESPISRSPAKGSQQHLDPIKKLLITVNVEQDNEREARKCSAK